MDRHEFKDWLDSTYPEDKFTRQNQNFLGRLSRAALVAGHSPFFVHSKDREKVELKSQENPIDMELLREKVTEVAKWVPPNYLLFSGEGWEIESGLFRQDQTTPGQERRILEFLEMVASSRQLNY